MTTFYDMPFDIQDFIYHKKHKADYKNVMQDFIDINEGWKLSLGIDGYIERYFNNVKQMNKKVQCKCCNKIIKGRDEVKYINGAVYGYDQFDCCGFCKDDTIYHDEYHDCFRLTEGYKNKQREAFKLSMYNGGFTKWLNESKRTKNDIKSLLKLCGIVVTNFDRTKKSKIIEILSKHFNNE